MSATPRISKFVPSPEEALAAARFELHARHRTIDEAIRLGEERRALEGALEENGRQVRVLVRELPRGLLSDVAVVVGVSRQTLHRWRLSR